MHGGANKDTERDDDGKMVTKREKNQPKQQQQCSRGARKEVGVMNGSENRNEKMKPGKKSSNVSSAEAYALSSSSTTLSSGILAILAPL